MQDSASTQLHERALKLHDDIFNSIRHKGVDVRAAMAILNGIRHQTLKFIRDHGDVIDAVKTTNLVIGFTVDDNNNIIVRDSAVKEILAKHSFPVAIFDRELLAQADKLKQMREINAATSSVTGYPIPELDMFSITLKMEL